MHPPHQQQQGLMALMLWLEWLARCDDQQWRLLPPLLSRPLMKFTPGLHGHQPNIVMQGQTWFMRLQLASQP
jgi:hypothetical protein